jgi:NAD(P) transhydrogenase subunit alpha
LRPPSLSRAEITEAARAAPRPETRIARERIEQDPEVNIFVPREITPGEARVAATPETVAKLVKHGHRVTVEAGAGARAHFSDEAYADAGATLAEDPKSGWAEAEAILKVQGPREHPELGHEADLAREGALLIGLCAPHRELDAVRRMRERSISALALELVPRITRAQSMDVLSSQASVAGYKAALIAAFHLDKHFPLMMTAAGTIHPAKVVVMGAGVAGLQALATCKRLGATVEVSDIREEVKEQVESLGGRFIELPMKESGAGEGGYAKEMGEDFLRRQREIVADRLAHADAAITTALVPGRAAPKLIDASMVERMRPGAVIVDLAVESGGNCELSVAGETVEAHGVTIVGPPNLPATMPMDASLMFARNVLALFEHVTDGEALALDPEDEVVEPALLVHQGEVRHARTREALEEEGAAA